MTSIVARHLVLVAVQVVIYVLSFKTALILYA